jgi:hypothetical protein
VPFVPSPSLVALAAGLALGTFCRPAVSRAQPPVGSPPAAAAVAPVPGERSPAVAPPHHTDAPPAASAAEPTVGVHGMLVLGRARSGRVLLSHLPLYRTPHDRQLLVVARLHGGRPTAAATATGASAEAARARAGVHTLEPERFPLARLTPADGQGTPVRFRGTLYRGHFERGGTPVLRDATVEVERVLVSETLTRDDPATPRRVRQAARRRYPAYLVWLDDELFLVHRIGAAPSFDQIVQLAPPTAGSTGPAASLLRAAREGAVPVVVRRERRAPGAARARPAVAGSSPLRVGEVVRLAVAPGHPLAAPDTVPTAALRASGLRVIGAPYLEFDDLRRPTTPRAPTPAPGSTPSSTPSPTPRRPPAAPR